MSASHEQVCALSPCGVWRPWHGRASTRVVLLVWGALPEQQAGYVQLFVSETNVAAFLGPPDPVAAARPRPLGRAGRNHPPPTGTSALAGGPE